MTYHPDTNTAWTIGEPFEMKIGKFLNGPKFGVLPVIDTYDENKELLKEINSKLDRLLSVQDYVLKNGIWVKP